MRAVSEAAKYHDRQIMATIGAITGQVDTIMGENLGEVSLGRFKPAFIRGPAKDPSTLGAVVLGEQESKTASELSRVERNVYQAKGSNSGANLDPERNIGEIGSTFKNGSLRERILHGRG